MKAKIAFLVLVGIVACGRQKENQSGELLGDSSFNTRSAKCAGATGPALSIVISQFSGIVKITGDSSAPIAEKYSITRSSGIVRLAVNPSQPVSVIMVQSRAILKVSGVCVLGSGR